jgi:hypothetical protein
MLTLLLVGGSVVAVTVVCVAATRADEVVNPVLEGDATLVGLNDTVTGSQKTAPPSRTEWNVATVSALCDAEDLLDSLERRGFAERELIVLGNANFAVRWR